MRSAYHQRVANERLANLAGAVGLAVADLIAAADAGLPAPADHPSCLAALNLLAWLPGTSPKHLAGALQLSQPATQRVVERLEAAGLARRERVAGERRLRLSCTAAGLRLAGRHRKARANALHQLVDTLTPEEAAALEPILERLASTLAVDADDVLRVCRLCRPDSCGPDEHCPIWTGYLTRQERGRAEAPGFEPGMGGYPKPH